MKQASDRIHPIWDKGTWIKDFGVNPDELGASEILIIPELQEQFRGACFILEHIYPLNLCCGPDPILSPMDPEYKVGLHNPCQFTQNPTATPEFILPGFSMNEMSR